MPNRNSLDRRTFLVAGGLSFFGLKLANVSVSSARHSMPVRRKIARSTIMIWLNGGASHIDTWDMKPDASAEYRGPFQPVQTSTPGITLCEHLPHLAKQAHHLAIIKSVSATVSTNDHHAGRYYLLTGHPPDSSFQTQGSTRQPRSDDWPFIGSVVAAKRPPHSTLPSLVWLPTESADPGFKIPGGYAARLGVENEPFYLNGHHARPVEFEAPSLSLAGEVTTDRLADRRRLLNVLDEPIRARENSRTLANYGPLWERAYSLLSAGATRSAFDITREPDRLRQRYGPTVNAMSMLMARRLVEAGVPFVTVYWYHDQEEDKRRGCLGGAWDTHYKNASCLRDYLLPPFDRAYSALLEDLHQRGLLDETLVLVATEMGRTPKLGDDRSGGSSATEPGRDHWTHCLSILLAGGGVRGGQVFGASDRRAEFPADRRVGPEHIARTVLYAMGIDDLHAMDREGRPFHLLEEGRPLTELF